MKFSIKDFFSKCDQIRRKLRIWSHLLNKSLMENFIFCAVFKARKIRKNIVTLWNIQTTKQSEISSQAIMLDLSNKKQKMTYYLNRTNKSNKFNHNEYQP